MEKPTFILADKKVASAAFTDGAGAPRAVDGIPVWMSTPPGAVKLTPSADGLTCECEFMALGAFDLTVAGKAAEPGAPVTTIRRFDGVIVGADATFAEIVLK